VICAVKCSVFRSELNAVTCVLILQDPRERASILLIKAPGFFEPRLARRGPRPVSLGDDESFRVSALVEELASLFGV
jgi:hypothetical protein